MAMQSESTAQIQLVARIRALHPCILVFAIANGGFRNPREAARLKAEGVLAGVPDLLVAAPQGPYHGLFIELKRQRGGRVSPAQAAVIGRLNASGYKAEVCYGLEDGWRIFNLYMGLDDA